MIVGWQGCTFDRLQDFSNLLPPAVNVQGIPPAGMGCVDCGGSCGARGLGLFDSGMDWTQWGVAEWATVAFGSYVVISLFSDTQRGYRTVRKRLRRKAA